MLTALTFSSGVSLHWPYGLTVGLIAVYWLWRVGRAAQQGEEPALAWWAVPGVLCLLAAPLLELDYLLGIAAALLLLAEFLPNTYRPGSQPALPWPLVGVILGGFLLLNAGTMQPEAQVPALLFGVLCLLSGLGRVVGHLVWPRRPLLSTSSFVWRAKPTIRPEEPELSVTVTSQGAEVRNISSKRLWIAGWSPATFNAWLSLRDQRGRPMSKLEVGQTAFLPLSEDESGVRIWYVFDRQPADQARLFQADWTPANALDRRVLN